MPGKRPRRESNGASVLVCSLDPCPTVLLQGDAGAYSRYYKHVDILVFQRISALLRAIELRYDMVHLFCPLAPGGRLVDADSTLFGSDLIARCCESGVKLLWVANENNADDYVSGFRAAGRRVNVVMTVDRNGANFDGFLEDLLCRVSQGDTLPSAWTAVVPQAAGEWQKGAPSCIFFAGLPDAKLLS